MDTEKLKEVFSDEGFVEKLLKLETPEEAQTALEEKGVSLSLDDIRQTAEMLQKVGSGELSREQLEAAANGELSEEELENVAGGSLTVVLTLVVIGSILGTGGLITHLETRSRW